MRMTSLIAKPAAVFAVAALAGAALLSGAVHAQQAWPSRPVTLVVPYGPGASNDTFTRALAQIFSKKFDQPFVVENRPGAGGFTGATQVAKATPDGSIFLESPNSIATFQEVLKLGIDPPTDLVPVSVFARSPIGMLVPSGLPVVNVKEFIDYAKEIPTAHSSVTPAWHGAAPACGDVQRQRRPEDEGRQLQELCRCSDRSRRRPPAGDVRDRRLDLGQINSGQLKLLGYTNENSSPRRRRRLRRLPRPASRAWRWRKAGGVFRAKGTPARLPTP